MRSLRVSGLILLAVLVSSPALSAPSRSTEPVPPQTAATPASAAMADPDRGVVFHPEAVDTEGAVEAGGHSLAFTTGKVTVEIQTLQRYSLWLPNDEPFLNATLPIQ